MGGIDTVDAAFRQDILHPGTRNLFRYWEKIRGERSAPLRDDIELREIRHLLPWIFIIETPSGTPLARLAGTGICQLWGENMTGRNLFAGWQRFERESITRLLQSVTERRQVFTMRVRAATANRQSIGLEIVGLPVTAQEHGETHVIGLIVPFRQPDWLGFERLVSFELASIKVIFAGEGAMAAGPRRPRPPTRSPHPLPFHVLPGGRSD